MIVGEEIKTADGDLICVFLERPIPPGLSPVETIAAARAQGGLVGIPHPFDPFRGSLSRAASSPRSRRWSTGSRATTHGSSADGNEQAVEFAAEHARPVVAVSDAHSLIEIGVAYSALDGDPSTPGRPARRAGEWRARAGSRHLLRADCSPRSPRSSSASRERPGPPGGLPARRRGATVSGRDGQDHRPMADADAGPVVGPMESTPAID